MPPIVVLACTAFEQRLLPLLPEARPATITFLDTGLHQFPRKLRLALQATLDATQPPSRVLVGYGLCGNGLAGVQSGAHTLVLPRSHDCIAILFGSRAAYWHEFSSQPGTYYVTPEWLKAGISPLHEYQRLLTRMDEATARWVMDQQYGHYQHLVFLAADPEEQAAYRPQALEVARYCEQWGLRYEERLGSDAYLRQLVQAARTLDESNVDFLIVPPGGVVDQAAFLDFGDG
jgi:hypothetical protein